MESGQGGCGNTEILCGIYSYRRLAEFAAISVDELEQREENWYEEEARFVRCERASFIYLISHLLFPFSLLLFPPSIHFFSPPT